MLLSEFAIEKRLTPITLEEIFEQAESASFKERVEDFCGETLPSDEIYHFCSTSAEWEAGMGSEGFVAVREKRVAASLIRRMN